MEKTNTHNGNMTTQMNAARQLTTGGRGAPAAASAGDAPAVPAAPRADPGTGRLRPLLRLATLRLSSLLRGVTDAPLRLFSLLRGLILELDD